MAVMLNTFLRTDSHDSNETISITRQTHTTKSDGGEVKIGVSASGPGTLTYTWKKDGEVITSEKYPNCTGYDTDTLSISPFSSLYEGGYSCVVSVQGGPSVESEVTNLKESGGKH